MISKFSFPPNVRWSRRAIALSLDASRCYDHGSRPPFDGHNNADLKRVQHVSEFNDCHRRRVRSQHRFGAAGDPSLEIAGIL